MVVESERIKELSNMTGSERLDRMVEILSRKQPPAPLSDIQKEISEEDFELL